MLFPVLGMASMASAHTLFTTLFINGENQGDGTCVRLPEDPQTATYPIYPLQGEEMACGYDGEEAVPYTCSSPSGARLTFEFRTWPDYENPGSIDDGHKGPCSVYMKKMDDMDSDSASGPGWFKVWEDGFRDDEWCVDRLVASGGMLSIDLPAGLEPGYYLVRPELLALHQAYRGDPQFYAGCAQIFVTDGPDGGGPGADETVSIPGYVSAQDPGLSFNLYEGDATRYEMPGPAVYGSGAGARAAAAGGGGVALKQKEGAVPGDCLVKNANWCARPVPEYDDEDSCWDAADDCWAQSKACWSTSPVTGSRNCGVWADYCAETNDRCESGGRERLAFGGKEWQAPLPAAIPKPW
ncbi:Glycosyl hydrolase family 61 [Geosmithia morbida]|uniref:lytic cellulose monooxygenase (C4-dehydrogenating) n=1 Tax=Geosmithia morbida TaxID=1094350 RepID=A0A9P4Z353_9HYPO|nr:Glycosyl hydrolase family 61 [Geosmithia morbida]KAF4126564.1 Glycosyl hydrolase family 61 [Geosmithia morbida]